MTRFTNEILEHLGLEPETLEMTHAALGAVVPIGSAAVHDVIVVDELHVAFVKAHGEAHLRPLGNGVGDVERLVDEPGRDPERVLARADRSSGDEDVARGRRRDPDAGLVEELAAREDARKSLHATNARYPGAMLLGPLQPVSKVRHTYPATVSLQQYQSTRMS